MSAHRVRLIRDADNDAETCRANGWVVGDRLVGDEGFGPDVIELTAIGERLILAKRVSTSRRNGDLYPILEDEASWTLSCRDWKRVEP